MEVVKTEETVVQPNEAKLIVVVGVDEISKQFLKEAIVHILALSGYSVNAQEFEKKEETDFHVVDANSFDIELEAKAHLVFSSFRKPEDVIQYEAEIDPDSEDKTSVSTMLNRYYELAKWMRSGKLAYTQDFDAPMNAKGLHNYNNLNNIIGPLEFTFQRNYKLKLEEIPKGKAMFSKVNPVLLIETIVPQLKEKSKEASDKFEQTKKEKAGNGGAVN